MDALALQIYPWLAFRLSVYAQVAVPSVVSHSSQLALAVQQEVLFKQLANRRGMLMRVQRNKAKALEPQHSKALMSEALGLSEVALPQPLFTLKLPGYQCEKDLAFLIGHFSYWQTVENFPTQPIGTQAGENVEPYIIVWRHSFEICYRSCPSIIIVRFLKATNDFALLNL